MNNFITLGTNTAYNLGHFELYDGLLIYEKIMYHEKKTVLFFKFSPLVPKLRFIVKINVKQKLSLQKGLSVIKSAENDENIIAKYIQPEEKDVTKLTSKWNPT